MIDLPTSIKAYLDSIDGDERFLITLGAGIVNTGLLMGGWLSESGYVTLTMGTVAVYIAGRTIDAFSKFSNQPKAPE